MCGILLAFTMIRASTGRPRIFCSGAEATCAYEMFRGISGNLRYSLRDDFGVGVEAGRRWPARDPCRMTCFSVH